MTMEKINDNQIRFILTGEDLAARQIRLSELAYGTEKARELFRDMMQQAVSEYGFDVSSGPLMIEAIPMHSGSIVLIVTRVDNPEELDPRFACFAPSVQNAAQSRSDDTSPLSLLEHLLESLTAETDSDNGEQQESALSDRTDVHQEAMRQFREFSLLNRLYLFSSMDMAIRGASILSGRFEGESILFRENGVYSLLLKMRSPEEVQSMKDLLPRLSEYGSPVPVTGARQQYLEEHGYTLIPERAVETLAAFNV